MSTISTSSTSPGMAPSMATGPVRKCGPGPRSLTLAYISFISRMGLSVAAPSRSSISGMPQMVSMVTTSPGFTVSTGLASAAKVAPLHGGRRDVQHVLRRRGPHAQRSQQKKATVFHIILWNSQDYHYAFPADPSAPTAPHARATNR